MEYQTTLTLDVEREEEKEEVKEAEIGKEEEGCVGVQAAWKAEEGALT